MNLNLETGKRLVHETTPCLPSSASISTASPVTFSPGEPSFRSILGNPGNGFASVDSRHQLITSGSMVPHLVETEGKMNQQRMERFLHLQLQNLMKHCDESDKRYYTQMLHYLSAHELSRHAVELERRSMQLSVEEAKEIQRMKALNILGKSLR